MMMYLMPAELGMAEADEDPLTVLSSLITQAVAHRVDQMLRIAELLSEDQPADEAERALKTIEKLLTSMRARRSVMLSEGRRSSDLPTQPIATTSFH